MNAVDYAHDRNAGGYYEYYGYGYYGSPRRASRSDSMAKGLIQTATWRSTTLIVSESALILGAVAASVYVRSWASLAGSRASPDCCRRRW